METIDDFDRNILNIIHIDRHVKAEAISAQMRLSASGSILHRLSPVEWA